MDDTPFFTFDINKFDEHGIASLKKFEKNNFNVEKILDSASTLLHLGAIKNYIQSQFNDPSDEFVKIIGKNVYSGKLMASVIEEFRPLIKRAIDQLMREWANERIKSALDDPKADEIELNEDVNDDIETTESEILGFNIVRAIASSEVSPNNINMRDAKSYCAILFYNNNRKPICRLHFNGKSKKYISIFENKIETKYEINEIEDIYKYSDMIRKCVKSYLND